jgi:hypothetical protein
VTGLAQSRSNRNKNNGRHWRPLLFARPGAQAAEFSALALVGCGALQRRGTHQGYAGGVCPLAESWSGAGTHRYGLALPGKGERVLVLAIDPELEMQMRPCGPPGGAHRANVLTLCDRLAMAYQQAA